MNEEWRPVVGYEGFYEVSSEGRVRRLAGTPGCRRGRVLRPQANKGSGYLQVNPCRDGKPKLLYVHELVALAFIGPRPVGCEINHIDLDRANPRHTNLEYVTSSGNKYHSVAMGSMPEGERCPWTKLSAAEARFIWEHFRLGMDNAGEWGERFHCTAGNIYAIAKGRSWKSVHTQSKSEVA